MKKIVAAVLVAVFLAFGGAIVCCGGDASAAPSQTQAAKQPENSKRAVTNLQIEGMTCGGCETSVKMVVKKLDGVLGANVSYEKKSATITYDPAKVSAEKIAEAIRSTLGYKVTVDQKAAAPPSSSRRQALSDGTTAQLREQFNAAKNETRFIAILSPTCGMCQTGQSAVDRVFTTYQKQPLKGFVVWLPMIPSDSKSAAEQRAALTVDPRVVQTWDGKREIGQAFSGPLKLKNTAAWDVYLVYAPGVEWKGSTPPAPTKWMHQLKSSVGADQKLCLNPTKLVADVGAVLQGRKKG